MTVMMTRPPGRSLRDLERDLLLRKKALQDAVASEEKKLWSHMLCWMAWVEICEQQITHLPACPRRAEALSSHAYCKTQAEQACAAIHHLRSHPSDPVVALPAPPMHPALTSLMDAYKAEYEALLAPAAAPIRAVVGALPAEAALDACAIAPVLVAVPDGDNEAEDVETENEDAVVVVEDADCADDEDLDDEEAKVDNTDATQPDTTDVGDDVTVEEAAYGDDEEDDEENKEENNNNNDEEEDGTEDDDIDDDEDEDEEDDDDVPMEPTTTTTPTHTMAPLQQHLKQLYSASVESKATTKMTAPTRVRQPPNMLTKKPVMTWQKKLKKKKKKKKKMTKQSAALPTTPTPQQLSPLGPPWTPSRVWQLSTLMTLAPWPADDNRPLLPPLLMAPTLVAAGLPPDL
jgi:hypothetical protein